MELYDIELENVVVGSLISDVKAYDEVVLIGKSGDEMLTADDMAQMLGTIGYEVVCDVGKRVQRIYL